METDRLSGIALTTCNVKHWRPFKQTLKGYCWVKVIVEYFNQYNDLRYMLPRWNWHIVRVLSTRWN